MNILKRLGLQWGFSTTKKYFIGFKVTVVLEKRTLTPISILIHPGAPSDARIFEGILKELKRRGLIKYGDKFYIIILIIIKAERKRLLFAIFIK